MAPQRSLPVMLALGIAGVRSQQIETPVTHWHLGNLGEDCRVTCGQRGLTCDPSMEEGLDADEMQSWVNSLTTEGYSCTLDGVSQLPGANAHPGYRREQGQPGLCLHGNILPDSPQDRQCDRSHPLVHRWCKCSSMIEWHLGNVGEDCYAACGNEGLVCDESFEVGFNSAVMQQVIQQEQEHTCEPPLSGSPPGFRPADVESGTEAQCFGDPEAFPAEGFECNLQQPGLMRWCKCSSVSTCPVRRFWCACDPRLPPQACKYHEFEQIYLDCDGDNYLDPYCRRRPLPGETWIWPSDRLEGCVETGHSCADTWRCPNCFANGQGQNPQ